MRIFLSFPFFFANNKEIVMTPLRLTYNWGGWGGMFRDGWIDFFMLDTYLNSRSRCQTANWMCANSLPLKSNENRWSKNGRCEFRWTAVRWNTLSFAVLSVNSATYSKWDEIHILFDYWQLNRFQSKKMKKKNRAKKLQNNFFSELTLT